MLPLEQCQVLLDVYSNSNFLFGATVGVILGVIASLVIMKLTDKD